MLRKLLLSFTLALLIVPAAPLAARADYCDPGDTVCQQLQQAKQAQNDAQSQLDYIKSQIANVQAQVVALVAQIKQLNVQIAAQQAQIDKTQAQIDATDRQIRLTQADIDRREAHLQVRTNLLDSRVRAMDKHGTVNYFELVVTAHSFSELVDRVVLMQDIIRGDQQLLDALKQDRAQVQKLKDDLTGQRAQEAALLKQQQDQKAALDLSMSNLKQSQAYMQQLDAKLQSQRADMEAEKARIDAQVQQLQQEYDQEAQNYGGGSGQFAWPLRGPITQPFGPSPYIFEPPYAGYPHFHTGIDIAPPCLTPIHAADTGIIALVNYGYGGGYGNYIVIVHGNGYSTLYAHQDHFSQAWGQGQVVRRGDVIGFEGTTGNSTGCHLHFEIRVNNAPQNPLPYLA